jgi:rare lipoprotein A
MRKALHNSIQLCTLASLALIAGCHHKQQQVYAPPPPDYYRPPQHLNHTTTARKYSDPTPVPSRVEGKPLSVQVGLSSWYGPNYNHQHSANGDIYDQNAMTAAHNTLPMGTIIRVTNLANGQSAIVKITDRGPFVHGRILDLSLAAAKATGVYRAGVAKVKIEVFSEPSTTSPNGKWCVQVGAFINPHDSIKLKEELIRHNPNARVIEFTGPTGHWVRVNTPQGDKSKAVQIASSIRPNEPDAEAYLVRLD